MDIVNKTHRPLVIPLPGGKKLRLEPRRTGQITPKAAEHPPVKALIDAGDIEVQDGGRGSSTPRGGGVGPSSSQRSGTGGVRHTGDR